jgi:hypothetical protein
MIEEPIVVSDVAVTLRSEDMTVQKVYLAPGGEPIPFTQENPYIRFTVPRVNGYQLVVIE